MRIWIDLANAPHVLFFRPIRERLAALGHEVLVTARAYSQTLGLAARYGIPYELVGGHGGPNLFRKGVHIVGRALGLAAWARGRRLELAVGHNSYAQAVAARALGIPLVTLMDYEHQPANHLNFRLARRVVVPRVFPAAALRRFGVADARTRRYDGLKEEVYLADFRPDPTAARFAGTFCERGRAEPARIDLVTERRVVVVLRTPPTMALYHRFESPLFEAILRRIAREQDRCLVVALARDDAQREALAASGARVFLPESAVDGPTLLAHADLLVGAGGTMNREAAVLGTPAYTVFAGAFAAVDEWLVSTGRLTRLATRADVDSLHFEKKRDSFSPTATRSVLEQVVGFILEGSAP
ncbi:MAG: DUF354 domain-containing protein [Planctomycetes bacterium]|nr:DUF354 domain-containing protein [Planctomycetota bacterium]